MSNFQRFQLSLTTLIVFLYTITTAQQIGTAVINDQLGINDNVLVNQRMRLNTITSTCVAPKLVCPGYFGNSGVYYKSYCYTNVSSNNECINVKLQVSCAAQIFCAAYLNSFDPTDVCNNYLADPGLSIANGGSDSMSFEVPAGSQYCVVVSGVVIGDTCESYTLRITQYATSFHGSLTNNDSTQTQRIFLDGIRNTCQNVKTVCANAPVPGTVNHDCYHYQNETPNDICLRTTLYHYCADSLSTITSVAYLNSYDSTDVCFNLVADAGVQDSTSDSLWYTFLVPAGSNCIIVVYSQKDSVYCDDYVIKLEADYTANVDEYNGNTSSIHLYPNPVLQEENLTIRLNDENYDLLELYDITARKIFSKNISHDSMQLIIPVSLLSKGIYLVKVAGEWETITRKVVVE